MPASFPGAKGCWAIGSDSHISISPVEELRWLEYGLRLTQRSRSMHATDVVPSTGRVLLDAALAGGARACGRKIGRIESGYRADLLILDAKQPRLYGRTGNDLLDSWIFSGNENVVRDVYVGGVQVIENGRHAREEEIELAYRQTIDLLGENRS